MKVSIYEILNAAHICHLATQTLSGTLYAMILEDGSYETYENLMHKIIEVGISINRILNITSYTIKFTNFILTQNDIEVLKRIFLDTRVIGMNGKLKSGREFMINKLGLYDDMQEFDDLSENTVNVLYISYVGDYSTMNTYTDDIRFVNVATLLETRYLLHFDNQDVESYIDEIKLQNGSIITHTGLEVFLLQSTIKITTVFDIKNYTMLFSNFILTDNDAEKLQLLFLDPAIVSIYGNTINNERFNMKKSDIEDSLIKIGSLAFVNINAMYIEFLPSEHHHYDHEDLIYIGG